jgi:hypothetical protein
MASTAGVAGLRVEDVDFSIDQVDARSAVVLDDVRDTRLRGLRAMAAANGGPLVWLHAVRDANMRELDPRGGRTIARLSGPETARIHLTRPASDQIIMVDRAVNPPRSDGRRRVASTMR